MRFLIYLCFLLFVISSCEPAQINPIHNKTKIKIENQNDTMAIKGGTGRMYRWHQDIDTILLGDMNGDGINDTAISTSPIHAYDHPTKKSVKTGCKGGDCSTNVSFSFDPMQIEVNRALGFQIFFAAGDLNDDGVQEVAFVPNWFWSCWENMCVYSLQNGVWIEVVSGTVWACEDQDFSKRVKKVGYKKFEFTQALWNEAAGMDIDTTIVYSLNE